MDQSGSRHPALKSPLIERPDLQSPRQRRLYGVLTLVFWAFWLYLWLPVLALLAWSLGVQQAYKYMVVLGGYRDVLNLLGLYSMIILSLGSVLICWALYNILRFRNVEKRTAAPPIKAENIALDFGLDPQLVARWQAQRSLLVTHDAQGHIAQVEALIDGAAAPI